MKTIEEVLYNIRDYDLLESVIAVYMRDGTTIEVSRELLKGVRYLEYEDLARVIYQNKLIKPVDTIT